MSQYASFLSAYHLDLVCVCGEQKGRELWYVDVIGDGQTNGMYQHLT